MVRWKIIGLLVAASIVAYLLRMNMSPAGDAIMKQLQLNKEQFSPVVAAFPLGYAIFQIPGALYGDRVGGRLSLAVLALLWGLLNVGMGMVPAGQVVFVLAVLRFLMGAAQAAFFPIFGGLVYHWFPAGRRALPNAMGNAGLTIGGALALPLVAWLSLTTGWRLSFVLTAPVAFVTAAAWYRYARDRPEEHPEVSPEELRFIRSACDEEATTGEPDGGGWRNPQLWLITLSYTFSNYVFYFFVNYLFQFLLEQHHLEVVDGGFMSSAPWLVACTGAIGGGVLCDALTRRHGLVAGTRWPCMAGLLLSSAFLVAAGKAADPTTAVLLLSLSLTVQQLTEGAFWAAAIAVSGRHSTLGCGILNTGGNAVGFFCAFLVPVIESQHGWPAALANTALFGVAGAALWMFIRADKR